jgi:two-component system, OmpR family, KDP operon response regulator KdpE
MSESGPAVLVIDDEPSIRALLRTSLGAEGYRVIESASGPRGAIDAGSHKPDVVIVDLGLPGMDGVDVIRHIRRWSPMPIIVLSARTQEHSKVEALDAGADDYVTKPFAMRELLARLRVAVRHRAQSNTGSTVLSFGEAAVDLEKRTATTAGRDIHLTPIEFRILGALAKHLGMVRTHRQLLTEVWGPTHEHDTHYLRVYMKQLREKLEKDPARPTHLLTEIGIGYRLMPAE